MTVYILQFDRPLGNPENPRGQARYYVGYCAFHRFDERMKEHKTGKGAAITRAAAQQGIGFRVIAKFWGGRYLERRFKNIKNTPKLVRKLAREGQLLGMSPVTINQQAILAELLAKKESQDLSGYDGRALYWLIRRGLVNRWQDGTYELTQRGLIAVTGEI